MVTRTYLQVIIFTIRIWTWLQLKRLHKQHNPMDRVSLYDILAVHVIWVEIGKVAGSDESLMPTLFSVNKLVATCIANDTKVFKGEWAGWIIFSKQSSGKPTVKL